MTQNANTTIDRIAQEAGCTTIATRLLSARRRRAYESYIREDGVIR